MSKENEVNTNFYVYKRQNNQEENYSFFKNINSYSQNQSETEGLNTIILESQEALDLDLIESDEFENVVDGAILKCSGCSNTKTVLQVTSQSNVYMQGRLAATIKDKEHIRNIIPFDAVCKFSGGKCKPLISEYWKNYAQTMYIGEYESITKKSRLKCEIGGIIEIEHTGQYPLAENISEYSEKLIEIVAQGGDKEKIKQKMSEYLSKVYNEKITVEDFKYMKGTRNDTLDITLINDIQKDPHFGRRNEGIRGHIDEYNKNGIFFSENTTVAHTFYVSTAGAEAKRFETKVFPIKGDVYNDSLEYYMMKNISDSDLKYIKDSWKIENEKNIAKLQTHEKLIEEISQMDVERNKFDTAEYRKELEKLAGDSAHISKAIDTVKRIMSNVEKEMRIPDLNVNVIGLANEDGKVIVYVKDQFNSLKRRDTQKYIELYKKNGIELRNEFWSSILSDSYADSRQSILPEEYEKEYIDGEKYERRRNFLTGIQVLGSAVVYVGAGYLSKNNSNSMKNTKKTGTVWDKIKATTENKVKNSSEIPATFEVEVNGEKIWINSNSTEHLGEKMKGYIKKNPNISPQKLKLVEQIYLDSYVGKIEEVTKNGIKLNETIYSDGWGFEFSQKKTDKYPVLIHSQPNQKK